MIPASQEERAVGAILDLVVDALLEQRNGGPTLRDIKAYCRRACLIVADLRQPPPSPPDPPPESDEAEEEEPDTELEACL